MAIQPWLLGLYPQCPSVNLTLSHPTCFFGLGWIDSARKRERERERESEREKKVKIPRPHVCANLTRSDVLELPYRWMLVVRKSNFTPLTADIQPLPAHLSRKPESRSQVDASLPVAGSAFGAGYEWAEFETVNDAGHVWVPPGMLGQQQQRQIWYYLGPSSTECRAQYTHNPSVPVHNPRANFLDSVRSLGALQAHSYSQHPYHQQKPLRYPAAPAIGALRQQAPPSLLPPTSTPTTANTAAAAATAPLHNNFLAPPSSRFPLLQQQRPLAPPPLHQKPPSNTTTSSVPPATTSSLSLSSSSSSLSSSDPVSAAPGTSAMPSAYRSLPSQSARHAPYPSVTTKSQRQLQQQKQQQQKQYLNNHNHHNHTANHTSDPLSTSSQSSSSPPSQQQQQQHQQANPAQSNTFANVRELIARRRLAQITDHANVFAGYTIVSPELVVETLLGPMGTLPPSNALEKLELSMAQQRVQPRAVDGTLLPLQPLNMRSEEVNRLLQMLRFSLVSHRERLDVLQKKESESPTTTMTTTTTITTSNANGGSGNGHGSLADTPADRSSVTANRLVAGKYAFLDQQRSQAPAVYRSPYDLPSGFTKYAEETYGLIACEPEGPQPSLANDYFASLSQTDQEKIMKTCGSYVQRAIERSTSHSRSGSASNFRLSSALAQQQTELNNPTIDITTVEDLPTTTLSGLDLPLHADSPCSSFSRSHLRFQSPNDFPSHGGIGAGMGMGIGTGVDTVVHPDHHDLFGDQQANTRFWQNGPWAAGDGNTPNEENRPFFGPHERLKNDYASSDISLGRGPGSLHSADMAGFGPDGTDDICAELSP